MDISFWLAMGILFGLAASAAVLGAFRMFCGLRMGKSETLKATVLISEISCLVFLLAYIFNTGLR